MVSKVGGYMAKVIRDELKIPEYMDFTQALDYLYSIYMTEFSNKETRPTIHGKKLYIDFKNYVFGRPILYWHLIGLATKHTFKVLPCNNTEIKQRCPQNCNCRIYCVDNRNICLYRGQRFIWILDIINIYNKNPDDSRIKWYYKKVYGKQRLHILYIDRDVEFIVVLEEYQKYFSLITGFTIFYSNAVDDYLKEWRKYWNSQKNTKKKRLS